MSPARQAERAELEAASLLLPPVPWTGAPLLWLPPALALSPVPLRPLHPFFLATARFQPKLPVGRGWREGVALFCLSVPNRPLPDPALLPLSGDHPFLEHQHSVGMGRSSEGCAPRFPTSTPWAWPPQTIRSLPLPPVWLATQNHSTLVTERSAVPFLPVNPEYSATRNQVSGLDRRGGVGVGLGRRSPLLGPPALWVLPFLAGCCLGRVFPTPGCGLSLAPLALGFGNGEEAVLWSIW